ncbi:NUDIX hydrolase [Streptomyces buecherae]|uniref:NUDIX hydrolase n=2 Tax=Streptomyces buecherae TaxID=2763006 RepID=UPI00164D90AA|nr:NUDIX hydrolase [Streptomyces buecherae]QNJ41350.1 NUDIX hydrolase [Streptomyces buecherae]
MNRYDRLRAERPDLFVNSPDGIDLLLSPEAVEAARRGAGAAPDTPVGVVYEDSYVTVVRDAVRFPDGAHGLYLRVLPRATDPGVVVLPLLPTGRVVLVEHYRHATRAWHWEVPRGMGEPGATGADSAARELREEIGARATELVPLGDVHPDTGLLGSRVQLFAARVPHPTPATTPSPGEATDREPGDGRQDEGQRGEGQQGEGQRDSGGDVRKYGGQPYPGARDVAEGIRRMMTVSYAALGEMIATGAVTDAFTIAAYTRARLAGLLDAPAPPTPASADGG